ncbi:MAG: NAD(P)H-dependent glycerol-3-phosphate dehydrogenase [Defluviitaleaceae bacterium]|nr:NAD(P)H-dependent glycerol-3-phosphate dehydrogenase [Defluviitaleaceae bacterium]
MRNGTNVTVLGSGSFGTALATVLLNNGHNVMLWSFSQEEVDYMQKNKKNALLPHVELSEKLHITSDRAVATKDAEIIVFVTPTKFARVTLEGFKGLLKEDALIINASKGLEEGTLERLSEVISEIYPQNTVAVISGPSHAEELVEGMPTMLTAAATDIEVAKIVQDLFMNEKLRIYTNTDIVGVELGGALKNIIALATGISDGVGYGDNTKAALMTRGLSEISRLGIAMGARQETFSGLSGVGDLIVTCTSMLSRNRRCGILLGQGKSVETAVSEIGMVVEGLNTVKAAYQMALKYNIDMPIVNKIHSVISGERTPKDAMHDLMTRERKEELS